MSELIKLSVSKSSTFNSCKKKYKFSYILKLPKKEYAYHTFGRFVHRILELFHLDYINGTTDSYAKTMSKCFNSSMEEFKGKITQNQKDEAFEICGIYLKKIKKDNNIKNILAVEKVFNLQLNDNLTLTGMIDRVQLDDDGVYHVVDYKTSKSSYYLQNDTLQLLTYAYVLYMENPELKKVRVSYIMLKLNCDSIIKEFELEEILRIKDIYEEYAANIEKETEFAASPSKLCKYCDFASVCPEGKQEITKDLVYGGIKIGNK